MGRGANVAARVTARIRESSHTLTVVYPMARPIITGTGPAAAPTNPLFGTTPVPPTIAPDAGTPDAPPVTVQCLWYDAPRLTSDQGSPATFDKHGWHDDADALARVLIADVTAAVDAPGKTILESCDYVEHAGRHYAVIQVTPIGAGTEPPVSCSVWLRTARQQ